MKEPNQVSKCCSAPMMVSSSGEGTAHYVCRNCMKACDINPVEKCPKTKGGEHQWSTSGEVCDNCGYYDGDSETPSKPLEKCECKTKYCKHYESDFDRFVKEKPLPIGPGLSEPLSTQVWVGEPYVSIDGVLYDLFGNAMEVDEARKEIHGYIQTLIDKAKWEEKEEFIKIINEHIEDWGVNNSFEAKMVRRTLRDILQEL